MRTPESYEKDKIKKYLDSLNCYYELPFNGGFGKSGTPDIIACINGLFFAIEVKRPGKEPTRLQWDRLIAIESANGRAFWGAADKVIPELVDWITSRGFLAR